MPPPVRVIPVKLKDRLQETFLQIAKDIKSLLSRVTELENNPGGSSTVTDLDHRIYTNVAGQTTFECEYTPPFVRVYLDGQKLPGGYTATTGTTIVLDTPIQSNDQVLEIEAISVLAESNGGADFTIDRRFFKGSDVDGKNIFPLTYKPPFAKVWVNGRLIPQEEYIANNSTEIVLSSMLGPLDILDLEGLVPYTVGDTYSQEVIDNKLHNIALSKQVAQEALDLTMKSPLVTLTNGRRTASFAGGSQAVVNATLGFTEDKYYFEVKFVSGATSGDASVGVGDPTLGYTHQVGFDLEGEVGIFQNSGNIYADTGYEAGGSSFSSVGSVVGVCVDCTARKIWFRVNNGFWNGSSSNDPVSGVGGIPISGDYPIHPKIATNVAAVFEFYPTNFNYTKPEGFQNWTSVVGETFTPTDVEVINPTENDTLVFDGVKFVNKDRSNFDVKRLKGLFSGLIANRTFFQSSGNNASTSVGVIPSGNSRNADVNVSNKSDPENASILQFAINDAVASIRSTASGTGTFLPICFYTNGLERLRISNDGNVGIGTNSPYYRLQVLGGRTELRANDEPFVLGLCRSGGAIGAWIGSSADHTFSIYQYSGSPLMNIGPNGILSASPVMGYGPGAGGSVVQAAGNKANAVTLNKPAGQITTSNAALAANASIAFTFYNTFITDRDIVVFNLAGGAADSTKYRIETIVTGVSVCAARITNISTGSLSEAIVLNFVVIKGSTS